MWFRNEFKWSGRQLIKVARFSFTDFCIDFAFLFIVLCFLYLLFGIFEVTLLEDLVDVLVRMAK